MGPTPARLVNQANKVELIMRIARIGVPLAALPLLAACAPGEGADAPEEGRTVEVRMMDDGGDFRYDTELIEVRRGDVVRFVQDGDIPHNVEFDRNGAPEDADLGDAWSGPMLQDNGEVYELEIDERFVDGTYEFLCTPHVAAEMEGTLVVEGGSVDPEPADGPIRELPEVVGEEGLQELEYERDDDGVKHFHLTAEEVRWETREGHLVDAMAYNRMIPGPLIRVTEGEEIRVTVENELDEPHTTHWHGLFVPNDQDGVPDISQDPIEPGEAFTYEFEAKPHGTRLYHSHFNAMSQEGAGLYGMFVIEERDPPLERQVDRDEYWLLGDGPLGYVINGKEFPLTQPIEMEQDERVRVRIANLGAQHHPMHLHGMSFTVVAKDGFPLDSPMEMNTLDVAPGETWDVILEPQYTGTWIWHCHVLSHATGPPDEDGNETSAGMIGAVVVHGDDGEVADLSEHTNH